MQRILKMCQKTSSLYNSKMSIDYTGSIEPPRTPLPAYGPVCSFENNSPKSSKPEITRSVYPGERFTISVVVSGQRNGIPATARSHIATITFIDYTPNKYVLWYQHLHPIYTVVSPPNHVRGHRIV